MDKKYIILFIASFVMEIASTFYIASVSHKEMWQMVFWAFIGPFLGLPFLKYQIEAKTDIQRFILAICYGFGYAVGALFVNLFL